MNTFEDYLKPEIEMWIENYKDEADFYEYDEEDVKNLDKLDLDDIATRIADNEYITEFLNNCIRDEIDKELENMKHE